MGLTQHTRAFEPWRNWHPLDRLTAEFVQQAFIWDVFDAIESGHYAMTNTDFATDIEGLAGTQDYVGINYYGRFYVLLDLVAMAAGPVTHTPDPNDPASSPVTWVPLSDSAQFSMRPRSTAAHPNLENGIADAAQLTTSTDLYG